MIYTYTYLPHRIENFNKNIGHFFEQLFANDLAIYDENVLLQPAFIPIVNRSPVTLSSKLVAITYAYHNLPAEAKQTLQDAFQIASNIEILCDDTTKNLVKFDAIHEDIRKILKDFSISLWEDFPQNLLVEAAYGQVQEHFNAFTNRVHQKTLVCPFCGLYKLKPTGSINRNAYDHYIPKAFYPFISINFHNLFPICHECNSDEKRDIDTLYFEGTRRKLFYPFDTHYQPSHLSITINPTAAYNPVSLKTLLNNIDWHYVVTYSGVVDPRVVAWDSIFHITRRYKENILVYQTEWFGQLTDRYKKELKRGTSFADFQSEMIDEAKSYIDSWPLGILRFVYFNFLFTINDFELKLNESLN